MQFPLRSNRTIMSGFVFVSFFETVYTSTGAEAISKVFSADPSDGTVITSGGGRDAGAAVASSGHGATWGGLVRAYPPMSSIPVPHPRMKRRLKMKCTSARNRADPRRLRRGSGCVMAMVPSFPKQALCLLPTLHNTPAPLLRAIEKGREHVYALRPLWPSPVIGASASWRVPTPLPGRTPGSRHRYRRRTRGCSGRASG